MTTDQQQDTAEEFRALKKKLTARIKQTGDTGLRRRHWNRTIKTATETNDLNLLRRLDTHFDLAPGAVLEATNIIASHKLENTEDSFHQLATFISQTRRAYLIDDEIASFIPLLRNRPADQERIADLIISNTTREVTGIWAQSTPERIEGLLDADLDDSWLPPSLRHHLIQTGTPISDRAYLSSIIDPEQHDNDGVQDIADATLHYFAEGLRTQRITPAHLEGLLHDQTHGKRTMQYSLLLESVNDIDTSNEDAHYRDETSRGLSGISAYEIFNGLSFMEPGIDDRRTHLDPLPMNTNQKFAEQSALFRFGFLLRTGITRYYQGRRNSVSRDHGEQLRDAALAQLIIEHNTPEEVASIAQSAQAIHDEAMSKVASIMSSAYTAK